MSERVEKKNVSEEKKEAQIEKETEERMVPEKEYRAVVQVSSSRFQSFHFPPHVLSCTPITSFSTQDLELLLSHREEIEKIQNFVADLQSAGLQGRVL